MSASHPILSRLQTGRPLLLSGDAVACLRAQGVNVAGPAATGRIVREHPTAVAEHYHQDLTAGVDVLCALTADTIPRSLQQIGMPFRSAALTGCAVDMALDAAELTPRPVIVAGVLGTTEVAHTAEDRLGEDLGTHAARLAAAGCELILARGLGLSRDLELARLSRRAAIVSATLTHLPTWALIALGEAGFTADGEPADECARRAFDEGAKLVLFEIPTVEVGFAWLDRLLAEGPIGFSPASAHEVPELWAAGGKRLLDAGARVLGGGAGTTHAHLAALSGLLRANDRKSIWPRAV